MSLYPFTDFFRGFEKVEAIRLLFGEKTEEVLNQLKVEFYSAHYGYMSTSDEDGHLLISSYHLRTGDVRTIYLDVVHELHHVKQFFEGRELFSDEFNYVDSPIEIEAYLPTVAEARRLGMTEEEIIDYLKVEWIPPDQFERFLVNMGLKKTRTV